LTARLLVGLAAGAATVAGSAAVGAVGGGDPDRGALVWVSAGCGSCHAFARAGSSGARGGSAPDLDRWLVTDAHRLGVPVEELVLRRVYWGGRGMPAYGTSLTAQQLDDLVSFVAGRPFSAPPGVRPLAPLPAPPPLVTAPPAVVARWAKSGRLRTAAARGAALFAKVGCLSCHTYRGSGVRRRGARDLTRIGRTGRSARSFAAYLAAPYRRGNVLMPSYGDLGADALSRLGAFLSASRG
jgi:mono/diheme cytochrome c family protein